MYGPITIPSSACSRFNSHLCSRISSGGGAVSAKGRLLDVVDLPTKSGAAVQVAWLSRRGSRRIEHTGPRWPGWGGGRVPTNRFPTPSPEPLNIGSIGGLLTPFRSVPYSAPLVFLCEHVCYDRSKYLYIQVRIITFVLIQQKSLLHLDRSWLAIYRQGQRIYRMYVRAGRRGRRVTAVVSRRSEHEPSYEQARAGCG